MRRHRARIALLSAPATFRRQLGRGGGGSRARALAANPLPPILAAAALVVAGAAAVGSAPTTLHRRTALFREDAAAARPVAGVAARLFDAGAGTELELTLAAQAPAVDPVFGIEGVGGTNLRTATELQRLLAEGTLGLAWRQGSPAASRTLLSATVAVARRRLPTRRIDPQRGLLLEATTAAALPAAVTFTASLHGCRGPAFVYVMADAVPRLRVAVDCAAQPPRITGIDSLGAVAEEARQ